MSLTTLKEQLVAVESKIIEIYKTGQEYTIFNSHKIVNPTLKELNAEADRIRSKIYRLHHFNTRTKPDFS